MKIKLKRILLFSLLIFTQITYAVESLPYNLINLTSKPGLALLKKDINTNTLKLLSHFTTQKTLTYCGIASAVMILNSTDMTPPNDPDHPPYQYFTQENFFNADVKKIILQDEVQKKGVNLITLSKVLQAYGLKAKPYFANNLNLIKFRKILINAIEHKEFVIVNFLRTGLHQKGGGHHSPIAAYDKTTDRFLLLDVARYKYPAYWVKTEDLWNGVNTIDQQSYRGFIVINH